MPHPVWTTPLMEDDHMLPTGIPTTQGRPEWRLTPLEWDALLEAAALLEEETGTPQKTINASNRALVKIRRSIANHLVAQK